MACLPASDEGVHQGRRLIDAAAGIRSARLSNTSSRYEPRPGCRSQGVAGPGYPVPGLLLRQVQLATQETAGTLLTPFHDPMNPKVVLAPAFRLPL